MVKIFESEIYQFYGVLFGIFILSVIVNRMIYKGRRFFSHFLAFSIFIAFSYIVKLQV